MTFVDHEAALFWLNDHCGEVVVVGVNVDVGDDAVLVFSAEGALTHWRDDPMQEPSAELGEDILGLYAVGEDAFLDVTQLTWCFISADGQRLRFGIADADDVNLTIVRPDAVELPEEA